MIRLETKDGPSLVAHKNILMSGSGFFKMCLSIPMRESREEVIFLDDIDEANLEKYLVMAYDAYKGDIPDASMVEFAINGRYSKTAGDVEELVDLACLCDRFMHTKLDRLVRKAMNAIAAMTAEKLDVDGVDKAEVVRNFTRGYQALLSAEWAREKSIQAYVDAFLKACSLEAWGKVLPILPQEVILRASIVYHKQVDRANETLELADNLVENTVLEARKSRSRIFKLGAERLSTTWTAIRDLPE